ncbi:MAG: hypothetical protein QOE51_3753 [Actinoplanes sp.]|jgi:hypothetical protein|nr:hypothetical protein [Actinoplanes sp.]
MAADESALSTTYVVDRQKAVGRFQALPWASMFESERQAMGPPMDQLWNVWDEPDDEFHRAYDDVQTAVSIFAASVGRRLLEAKRRQPTGLAMPVHQVGRR